MYGKTIKKSATLHPPLPKWCFFLTTWEQCFYMLSFFWVKQIDVSLSLLNWNIPSYREAPLHSGNKQMLHSLGSPQIPQSLEVPEMYKMHRIPSRGYKRTNNCRREETLRLVEPPASCTENSRDVLFMCYHSCWGELFHESETPVLLQETPHLHSCK